MSSITNILPFNDTINEVKRHKSSLGTRCVIVLCLTTARADMNCATWNKMSGLFNLVI